MLRRAWANKFSSLGQGGDRILASKYAYSRTKSTTAEVELWMDAAGEWRGAVQVLLVPAPINSHSPCHAKRLL
jgi:hypothetical protein